jgi:DNA polymerase III epsilon subunit family exonuclease
MNTMDRPISERTFVVVDLETTGISASDRICEIGMTKVKYDEITDRFDSLINPGVSINNTIFHGIEDWMVQDAPLFKNIAHEIVDFMNGSILVAHNAPFDMRFLRYELQRLDTDLSHHALCTLKLARKMHPDFPAHKLDYLLGEYDIVNEHHHRASADAISCARLFLQMKRRLEAEGKNTMAALQRWGLPYDHQWRRETVVPENTVNSSILTRDDVISPIH